MKKLALLVIAALLVAGFLAVLVWKFIEAKQCYDDGGIVVFPMMRYQECVMPADNAM